MWTRAALKTRAKAFLRVNYLHAFIVSLILALIGGSIGGKSNSVKMDLTSLRPEFTGVWHSLLVVGVIFAIMFAVAAIVFKIFVGAPLEVGCRKYYVKTSEGEVSELSYITSMFRSSGYKNVVLSMFMKNLYVFLWTLLLIVPGIVKGYAYSMVPYILAENPQMDYKDAMRLSDEMTYTHKMSMFVLDLSFIGWYILGALLFGIGTYFVNPYVDATKAQLYQVLKKEIIAENLASNHEFEDFDERDTYVKTPNAPENDQASEERSYDDGDRYK